MFDEEKIPSEEQKPAEPVDMFSNTQEAASGALEQQGAVDEETASQAAVQTMDEQEYSHRAFSRRNMILAIIAFVVVLLIIGGAATYFFVFKKSSEVLTPQVEQVETEAPSTVSEQQPFDTQELPVGKTQPSPEQQSILEEEPQVQTEQPATTAETPLDTDQDGLSDEEETGLQTDINSADTDSDGLTDREEVQVYKTSPLSADTDSDGFLDKQELDNGFDPNGSGKLPSGIPAQ